MDAVTYPDPIVTKAISESFIPLKIDLLGKHPDIRDASLGQRVLWSPTFILTDAKHRELRRWVGWLAPGAFVGELKFVQGMAAFNGGDFGGAREIFQGVIRDYSDTPIEPEARYFEGICGFLAGRKDFDALGQSWRALAEKFPQTRFGQHASVIADVE